PRQSRRSAGGAGVDEQLTGGVAVVALLGLSSDLAHEHPSHSADTRTDGRTLNRTGRYAADHAAGRRAESGILLGLGASGRPKQREHRDGHNKKFLHFNASEDISWERVTGRENADHRSWFPDFRVSAPRHSYRDGS